ncbi:MAG: F0F1 ATP synthase subunit epsilon [Rothia sp. (in: high G+C Gram-positive bacteria)]|nr:F0F1 ATP synthase subunit epsilon [Rothia sp. (in: high G+C Gram-positive bacteria)]
MALKVEVVSREHKVWTGEASYVRARSLSGDIGIMPGHIPTMALLADDGELLIKPLEGEDIVTRLQEGFLTVSNDRVTIAAKHARVD